MNNIPCNKNCHKCGELTWRRELGSSDRHWDGGYVCKECASRGKVNFIGLISSDGKTEWNARFCIGNDGAEKLEHGKIYTYDELNNIAGESQAYTIAGDEFTPHVHKRTLGLKESKRWRCEISQ